MAIFCVVVQAMAKKSFRKGQSKFNTENNQNTANKDESVLAVLANEKAISEYSLKIGINQ